MSRLLLNNERLSKLLIILHQNSIYNKQDVHMALSKACFTACVLVIYPRRLGAGARFTNNSTPGLAWSTSGKWPNIFQALVVEPDMG